MKFECPRCRKLGQIDDANVPENGVFATCPQCSNRFLIRRNPPKDFVFDSTESFSHQTQIPPSSSPLSPNNTKVNSIDNIALYKAAIGKNFDKYASVVREYEQNQNTPVTWHWPACFVGPIWLLYRKMYAWFALYFVVLIFFSVLDNINQLFSSITYAIIFVLFTLFAKVIYVKHVSKMISKFDNLSDESKLDQLKIKGGVHSWVPYLAILPVIAVVAAIAIPQFSNYREKNRIKSNIQINQVQDRPSQLSTLNTQNNYNSATPIHEKRPAYGESKLTEISEIYYCLSEELRINTMKSFIVSSLQQTYNDKVIDYNQRCSNRFYDGNNETLAKQELAKNYNLIKKSVIGEYFANPDVLSEMSEEMFGRLLSLSYSENK